MPPSTLDNRSRASTPTLDEANAACAALGLPIIPLPAPVAREAVNVARLMGDRSRTQQAVRVLQDDTLPALQAADLARFAANLAAGVADEDENAETLAAQQELAALERRLDALEIAETAARGEFWVALDAARANWQPRLDADLDAARTEWAEAMKVLRQAHARLSAAGVAAFWLQEPGRGAAGIASHAWLVGSENTARPGEPLMTTAVLDALDGLGVAT